MKKKIICVVMMGMMLTAGLSLSACAATGRPEPIAILNETETVGTEADEAGNMNRSYSVNHGYSFGTGTDRGINSGLSSGFSESRGWSYSTSEPSESGEQTNDGITFGWFDTEGFHVATSGNLDRINADNEKERGLAEDTGRVYGWLDSNGFHPLEDAFNEDGTASEEMRSKMDEFRENYDHVKSVIDDVRNNMEESEIADELAEDIEDAEDDYLKDEDYGYDEDDETEEYGEYDDEYTDEYDDEDDEDEDEFYDDEEDEDFYSDSLVGAIDTFSDGQVVENEDGMQAESLIEGMEPAYIIVEEDVLESKNVSRNNSKGTVSGKEKSGFSGEAENGRSESDSFSTTFGTGESEGTGMIKGRRYYYIYDMHDRE